MVEAETSEYAYDDAACRHAHAYLLPTVERMLCDIAHQPGRAFDLGCGSGAVAHWLHGRGYTVCGCDPSQSGITQANAAYPDLDLRAGSTDDDLPAMFGAFPLVVSLEVVEHVFSPRAYVGRVHDLLDPGGHAIISTPYHGYLKNLALAVTGRMDAHFTAMWEGGHIKFWSAATLGRLLRSAGLDVVRVARVGRFAPLAKSMVVLAQRPI